MSRHAKRKSSNPKRPKTRLGLPDLDHSKSAVLDSLRSPESKRGYRYAIDEFIRWYCSEPRLSFNKVVVTRYRIFLESRQLAAGTINGRLAAVRRLAYEAADAGLVSPELAAGIRRVKGAKKLGVRFGNWLTADEARQLWQAPDPDTLKGKRDRAILAVLLGCGLRRRELAELAMHLTHVTTTPCGHRSRKPGRTIPNRRQHLPQRGVRPRRLPGKRLLWERSPVASVLSPRGATLAACGSGFDQATHKMLGSHESSA
jgi:hypothetical protein